MRNLVLFGILNMLVIIVHAGQPVPGAEVYIEQDNNEAPIAYQQTGDNGKVTFSHLSDGKYSIVIKLPEQSGKFIRKREKIDCKLKAGYNNEDNEYYLSEPEGFFVINFSKLRKLDGDIKPVYDIRHQKGEKRIEISRFEVDGRRGSLTISIETEKPKKFQKLVEKVRHDAAMSVIRNMK